MKRNDDKTALLLAAQMGNLEILTILLDHGADIHDVACDKKSALHLATLSGNEDVVKVLLDKGIKIDVKDEHGRLPLHE